MSSSSLVNVFLVFSRRQIPVKPARKDAMVLPTVTPVCWSPRVQLAHLFLVFLALPLATAVVTSGTYSSALGLVSWLADWLAESLVGLLAGWSAGPVAGWSSNWLAGPVAGWLVGWLSCWSGGWLSVWSGGWLKRWLIGPAACLMVQ